jgi:Tol biopolymer transport system component
VGLHPRYAATGHLVFARVDGTVMAAPLDVGALALTSEPAAIFGNVSVNTTEGYAELVISPSGRLAYRAGGSIDEQLVWVGRDGSEVPVDTSFSGDFGGVALSPDGSHVVAHVSRQADENIFVKDLAGGPWRRVSFEAGVKNRPAWLPTEPAVSYQANRGAAGDSSYDVLVANADGSGNARVVLDLDTRIQEATWSPDGEWLVYRVGPLPDSRRDLYAISGGGTGDTVVLAATRFDEHSPAVSPDGRWLAYVSNESGRTEIFVRPFPDITQGKWQVSAEGGTEPVWGRTGREIFYRSADATMMAARYVADASFAVVERAPLFQAERYSQDPLHPTFDVSNDDQRFLLARGRGDEGTLVLVQGWFQELLSRVGEVR